MLLPEKAIGLFVAAAQDGGATVRLNTPVSGVQPAGNGVRVRLGDGEVIDAGSAIVAPGPWIKDLIPELGGRLQLTRQPLLWFDPVNEPLVRPDRITGGSLEGRTVAFMQFSYAGPSLSFQRTGWVEKHTMRTSLHRLPPKGPDARRYA